MLPRRLPAPGPLTCDRCRKASLQLQAADFDAAWREVHAAGWMLEAHGRGQARRWAVLCPECRPRGDTTSTGYSTAATMPKKGE